MHNTTNAQISPSADIAIYFARASCSSRYSSSKLKQWWVGEVAGAFSKGERARAPSSSNERLGLFVESVLVTRHVATRQEFGSIGILFGTLVGLLCLLGRDDWRWEVARLLTGQRFCADCEEDWGGVDIGASCSSVGSNSALDLTAKSSSRLLFVDSRDKMSASLLLLGVGLVALI